MTGFLVLKKRCNQCLFGKSKIVSDARRDQIVKGLDHRDDFFVCHKATIAGVRAACHGDYKRSGAGRVGRMAKALGLLSFVDEADLARQPKQRRTREDTDDD